MIYQRQAIKFCPCRGTHLPSISAKTVYIVLIDGIKKGFLPQPQSLGEPARRLWLYSLRRLQLKPNNNKSNQMLVFSLVRGESGLRGKTLSEILSLNKIKLIRIKLIGSKIQRKTQRKYGDWEQ